VTSDTAGATQQIAEPRADVPAPAARARDGIGADPSLCSASMFSFTGGRAVEFLPDEEARAWVAEGLQELVTRLGAPARAPRLVLEPSIAKPRDLDDLFALVCSAQAEVGQSEIEFTLLELQSGATKDQIPRDFVPLGDPDGQLVHTFARGDELLLVVVPSVLKVPTLVLGSVARELGRIAIARHGGHRVEPEDREADAELAAIAIGLGVWVANGAYIYDNKCCGGGCGIDLTSLSAGLSMPEACFALAIDAHRRGISPRVAARHLEATQKAALKQSAGFVRRTPAIAGREFAALGE
jgi:hypothetical protein